MQPTSLLRFFLTIILFLFITVPLEAEKLNFRAYPALEKPTYFQEFSNNYPAKIIVQGKSYSTVSDYLKAVKIQYKEWGNLEDPKSLHAQHLAKALRIKFTQHKLLGALLMATSGLKLAALSQQEENLGTYLMQLRADLFAKKVALSIPSKIYTHPEKGANRTGETIAFLKNTKRNYYFNYLLSFHGYKRDDFAHSFEEHTKIGNMKSAQSAANPLPTPSERLVKAALERTTKNISYVPAYVSIEYPLGDVPEDTGVCTDVIIRSYRKLGIDLQQLVHEDMKANFNLYPKKWGLKKPDTNIDHRRVPNLRVFFKRFGQELPVSKKAAAYRPGDLVTWDLNRFWKSTPHIGIVSDAKSKDKKRYLIVHNIGFGPKLEDVLFDYKITGHYRYPRKLD